MEGFSMGRNNLTLLSLITALLFFVHASAQDINLPGTWQGKLEVSGQELRIVFNISQNEDGGFSAKMDSPDQGAANIPVSSVLVDEREITLNVKSINGVYKGTLQDDNQTIKGAWTQSGYEFPLNLKKGGIAPPISRPQEPKRPFPYEEKEVLIKNSEQGISLSGILTLPKSSGPHAAIILISGSGAQDRDETILGHKPFFVLSDYLTRRGFAVLRYDDRGVGGSTGKLSTSTNEDLATDVIAAVNYLKELGNIDKNKIGLIGHSEGGIIAQLTAVKIPGISFIVLMAAPGINGLEIICDQAAYSSRAYGLNEEVVLQNVALQRKILEIVKNEKDNKIAAKKLNDLLPENKKSQIKILLSVKYRSLISFDPAPVLQKVKCPVLAINGGKDSQVNSKKNLEAIAGALSKGGNTNYSTQEIPNVNHLFQTANTGSVSEYGKIEETISPKVLELIVTWLQKVNQ
jgi:pimeloyl-ACP methyl ester carboxylesterase